MATTTVSALVPAGSSWFHDGSQIGGGRGDQRAMQQLAMQRRRSLGDVATDRVQERAGADDKGGEEQSGAQGPGNPDGVESPHDGFQRVADQDGDDDGNEELAGGAQEHCAREAGEHP